MTFYPDGLEKGNQKLPHGKNYGKIIVECCMIYGVKEIFYTPRNESDIMFIDYETKQDNHKQMSNEPLIHLGTLTKFNRYDKGDAQVKPHIDIFIPLTELDNWINILNKIKLDRNMGLL